MLVPFVRTNESYVFLIASNDDLDFAENTRIKILAFLIKRSPIAPKLSYKKKKKKVLKRSPKKKKKKKKKKNLKKKNKKKKKKKK